MDYRKMHDHFEAHRLGRALIARACDGDKATDAQRSEILVSEGWLGLQWVSLAPEGSA